MGWNLCSYRGLRSLSLAVVLGAGVAVSCHRANAQCWFFELEWPTERNPTGIATDHTGYVYVTCGPSGCIQKFTNAGELCARWGQRGSGPGQFLSPQGIAIDPSGYLYVADKGNRRIQKFKNDGSFLTQWSTYDKGAIRSFQPIGIAVDLVGKYVYVTDGENQRVLKFTRDGFPVRAWGGYGTDNMRFLDPRHIAVDKLGAVYVADSSANTLKKFTNLGSFRKVWGGGRPQLFSGPVGVTVDYSGYLYVTDATHCVVQLDQNRGRKGWFGGCDNPGHAEEGCWHDVASTHGSLGGTGRGQFKNPHGIASDLAGNLYVADFDNHRIQKLVTLQTSTTDRSGSSR